MLHDALSLTEVSNNACQYIGRYGNSNMGTKKNNHTDPICFCCFEKKTFFLHLWKEVHVHLKEYRQNLAGSICKGFFVSRIVY